MIKFLNRLVRHYIKRASNEDGFIQAIPYVLQGLSAMGGIFGHKKKYIDPEMLRQKYGPAAVASDAQQLSNHILNSPYGQQLMASAATQGQGLESNMAQNAARSGLDASSGGESGASTFATGAASQAQAGLERGVKADVWKSALPIAAQQNQGYADLEMQNNEEQNNTPNAWQRIGAAAGQAASMFPGQKKTA